MTGLDGDGYPSMSSDHRGAAGLSHQIHMTNLLTRVGWERAPRDPALHAPFVAALWRGRAIAQMMSGIAAEVVDYVLFVDEAPLADRIRGSSAFVRRFSAAGPARCEAAVRCTSSDLSRRMMKLPAAAITIYSAAFDALTPAAKDPIYRRMWTILSGEETGARYRTALFPRRSASDRGDPEGHQERPPHALSEGESITWSTS